MINVIWVDDLIINPDGSQTDLCKSIVNSAYDEGIDITPFATYDEAYCEMEKFPSKWIAVILDVRNDRAAEGDENQGYLEMRRRIESFRKEHSSSVEPYIFVFSADPVTIKDAKRYFIKDAETQTKEVYIKPQDTNALLEDIKNVAAQSKNYAAFKKHEIVLDAMSKLEWDSTAQSIVFNLIKSIDIDNDYKNDIYYNRIRKLLESTLYARLERVGIMNKYVKSIGDSVEDSINKKSRYIGKNNDVPIYVQRAFHSLTEIVQNGSHDALGSPSRIVERDPVVARDTREGKAPYLLRSCLYDLLTIIMWEAQL